MAVIMKLLLVKEDGERLASQVLKKYQLSLKNMMNRKQLKSLLLKTFREKI